MRNLIESLNENETKVLKACKNEMMDCTSGDFGYIEDVSRLGLSKHEFAGYIGSLTKKGAFEYLDSEFHGQFAIKKDLFDIIK